MNQAALRFPSEYSKPALALLPATGNTPAPGPAIDRTGYASAIADVAYACSGGPTGGTLTLQLQDSSDGAAFANFGAPAVAPVGANGVASLAADLSGARQFVRLSVVGAPIGGTSPVVTAGATLRLFGPDRLPAI